MKYIKDAVHGDIAVPEDVLPIIDHPLFQRLRYISQLGLAYMVYPSARHSRFEHSLGVYHLTKAATGNEVVHIYGLLHDVGHGPFSHVLEAGLHNLGYTFDHEKQGSKVMKEILQDTVFSHREVMGSEENLLVNGGVGTDRIDYLIRDSYFTGVKIGYVEWERIVRNMWVEDGKLVVSSKVLSNVEHLFIARFILGDAVYLHKTLLILGAMFTEALRDLLEHYSVKEIVTMNDISVIQSLREINSPWWDRIERRDLFKIYTRGEKDEVMRIYEDLRDKYGEDAVLLGKRESFYKKPATYIEGGIPLEDLSPLIKSLRKSEESRRYWFVAVDPHRVPRLGN